MSANPYESPETPGSVGKPKEAIWPSLGRLIVLLAALALLVALFMPFTRGPAPREAARRMQCSNNLRQISIALHNYQDAYGCLPPAYTVDQKGKPLHSWRTLILPFIEQKALYDKIDLTKAWNDPVNQVVADAWPRVYRCPSAKFAKNQTGYLGIVAPGSCFQPTEPRQLIEITDQKSLTLMVVEVPNEDAVHWMSPNDASEELILNIGTDDRSTHPSGVMAACVDGRVFFMPSDASTERLKALISIAGKDDQAAEDRD